MAGNEREQEPKSALFIHMTEADWLFQKGEYSKAVDKYSMALESQPGDRNCLVARSRCYLKMRQAKNALKDAEASLKDDKSFYKGLYQKAQALYIMGEFEFALVFYHRGHRLRPELQECRLGVQKSEEAIINSVGSECFMKKCHPPQTDLSEESQRTPMRKRTAKQLLEMHYTDKEFLEKLLKDKDLVKHKTRTGERMQNVITGCISYLDTVAEFRQQQKPICAHKHDGKPRQQQYRTSTQSCTPSDPNIYVLRNLEEIDTELTAGNTVNGVKKARELLKTVKGWSDEALPNKTEVLGNLYSCIGTALMGQGNMGKALENHLKDLELAQQGKLMDSKSRALDNIGRVYARLGQFHQAIKVWEEKIPLVQGSLEKAWLFHEIGCCYLELKNHIKARDYGMRSLDAANDICDGKWQLDASMLVAQAELKLDNYKSSVLYFEKALDQAKLLQDNDGADAIQKALQEARQHMSQ